MLEASLAVVDRELPVEALERLDDRPGMMLCSGNAIGDGEEEARMYLLLDEVLCDELL